MAMKILSARERKIMDGRYTVTAGQQVQIPNARTDRRYNICLSVASHAGANMEVYLYFDGIAGTAGGRAFQSGGHGASPTESLTLPAVFLGQIIYGESPIIRTEVSEFRTGIGQMISSITLGTYFYNNFVHLGTWSTMSILFPNPATVDITVTEKVV